MLEDKQIVIRRLKKTSEEQGFLKCTYSLDSRLISAIQMIRQWKKDEGFTDNPFLFPSRRTASQTGAERLSQLRDLGGFQAVSRFTAIRKFKAIAQAARVPEALCHNSLLRPTRSIVLLAAGMTPEDVRFVQGHRNMQMTHQYLARGREMRGKLTRELSAAGLVL
jgi:integrase